MAKIKKKTPGVSDKRQFRQFYSLHPWRYSCRDDCTEITAYVEASGNWETVAMISATSGMSAETMAQFICGLVNEHQRKRDVLHNAISALELVLNEGMTFSSEMAAEKAVSDIKKIITG